jgi:SpoVK/Ycf46/Vps4 family AAA+-type ATPase
LFRAVKLLVAEEVTPLNRSGMAFVLARRGQDISLLPIGKGSKPLERDNYNETVLSAFDHVIEDLKTDDPCGRMVLYSGPAGSGKTYLVRAMMESINDGMFLMIPPTMVGEIANPELVTTLIKTKERKEVSGPTVLVIEDADVCLLPRDGGNLGLISNLLNFSDGIVGSLMDIRVVCTTNALQDNIDKALLRPGRICRRVTVPELDTDHAHRVYTRLTGQRHPQLVTQPLAAVYSKARDSGWRPPAPPKVVKPPSNRYDDDYEDD